MTIQVLPFGPSQEGQQIYEYDDIRLENLVWQFRLRWSYTAEAWRMDMSCAETGTDLKGLTLAPGHNLLTPHAVLELGAIWVVDTESEFRNPDFAGLGTRYKTLYIPLSDLDALPI